MPEPIVERLEQIEIDHDERALDAIAAAPRHLEVQAAVEAPSVCQFSERVGLRQLLQRVVTAPQRPPDEREHDRATDGEDDGEPERIRGPLRRDREQKETARGQDPDERPEQHVAL